MHRFPSASGLIRPYTLCFSSAPQDGGAPVSRLPPTSLPALRAERCRHVRFARNGAVRLRSTRLGLLPAYGSLCATSNS